MKTIQNVDLLKLQTGFMQQDHTTKALCAALTPELNKLAYESSKCLIIPAVDSLSDDVLDELAIELHIDWYSTQADINIKRALIRNSDKVHMYMGTPYAIEQVIHDYFGDGRVEEWFEYSGQPYHFRVITSNPSVTGATAAQFLSAMEKIKRKSTRLDQIIISLSAQQDLFLAAVIMTAEHYIFEQEV